MYHKEIDGFLLKRLAISAANNLHNNREILNQLNVYPVPDGDTGTNMSLTFLGAAGEIKDLDNGSVSQVADILSTASLRSARGNSGVILSQFFRGFARGVNRLDTANVHAIAEAFKQASDTAYRAVMRPTEGTILTVGKDCARAGMHHSLTTDDVTEFLESCVEEANKSLSRTTQMLDILKKSNVVDAGAKGLVCILEGALSVLKWGIDIQIDDTSTITDNTDKMPSTVNQHEIKYMYCTEFLINKNNSDAGAEKFRAGIERLGDSTIVINDRDIIKVHIHTNCPGVILQEGLRLGSLSRIKIDNMQEQHNSTLIQSKEYGIAAVAAGEGLTKIFTDMGADKVISGGQSMNPSADEILKALSEINAKNIFILPNNKNIIPAAQQTKNFTDKNIIIMPTKSIPQGIACLLVFSHDRTVEVNQSNMQQALERTKTGHITFAVRDCEIDGMTIVKGDVLGINEDTIQLVGNDMEEICLKLVDSMVDCNSTIITIFTGIDAEISQQLEQSLNDRYPDCDIEIQKGGQPLYSYIISVE